MKTTAQPIHFKVSEYGIYDIFISYASKDRNKAIQIVKALEQHGYTVFWDRTIPPGKSFDLVIKKAITAAKCVIVLWSKKSIKSDWVKEEASIGKKRQILVPALIDRVKPPIGFGLIQTADLEGWKGDSNHDGFKRLINALEDLIETHQHPSVIFKEPQKDSSNLLHQYWENLEPDLQDAFALAYNQARREGSIKIGTRNLFAAMIRLKPEPLHELFEHLPKGSLPEPIIERSKSKKYVLEEEPVFSPCVADSLEHIGKHSSLKRKISTKDVFVDIAKHGTGTSVERLRKYKVSSKKIDQIVRQLGWTVVER